MGSYKRFICYDIGGVMSLGIWLLTTLIGFVVFTVAVDLVAEGLLNVYI